MHDNNNNGKEIAYASFTVSDFCVRIKSGLDQNLCGNNDMNAEDWAGSELEVSGGLNTAEQVIFISKHGLIPEMVEFQGHWVIYNFRFIIMMLLSRVFNLDSLTKIFVSMGFNGLIFLK